MFRFDRCIVTHDVWTWSVWSTLVQHCPRTVERMERAIAMMALCDVSRCTIRLLCPDHERQPPYTVQLTSKCCDLLGEIYRETPSTLNPWQRNSHRRLPHAQSLDCHCVYGIRQVLLFQNFPLLNSRCAFRVIMIDRRRWVSTLGFRQYCICPLYRISSPRTRLCRQSAPRGRRGRSVETKKASSEINLETGSW